MLARKALGGIVVADLGLDTGVETKQRMEAGL